MRCRARFLLISGMTTVRTSLARSSPNILGDSESHQHVVDVPNGDDDESLAYLPSSMSMTNRKSDSFPVNDKILMYMENQCSNSDAEPSANAQAMRSSQWERLAMSLPVPSSPDAMEGVLVLNNTDRLFRERCKVEEVAPIRTESSNLDNSPLGSFEDDFEDDENDGSVL